MVFGEFCELWGERVEPFTVRNDYYGGDVNEAGLIVAKDLLDQLPRDLARTVVVLPEVMFNFDSLTLDGVPRQAVVKEIGRRGGCAIVSVPNPPEQLAAIREALG
jgi:hypothetical protein